MNKVNDSRMKMASGILQLSWAEIKTLNLAKLKGIWKIAVGYVGMKLFGTKKQTTQQKAIQQKELQETAYRLSS